jgi:hypothetical protein
MEDTINAKHNYFMGTIMICVVYGILAILMLSVGYFTTMGNEILFNTLLYFTVTFVIGTIVVIIITTIMILQYEPPDVIITNPGLYSNNTCPDYWKYEDVKDTNKPMYGNDVLYTYDGNNCNVNDLPQYKLTDTYKDRICVPDNTIMTGVIGRELTDVIYDDNNFKNYLANMQHADKGSNVDTSNICSHIFPEYLAFADNERYIETKGASDTNHYRCKYAEECGIPWTGAGCS